MDSSYTNHIDKAWGQKQKVGVEECAPQTGDDV